MQKLLKALVEDLSGVSNKAEEVKKLLDTFVEMTDNLKTMTKELKKTRLLLEKMNKKAEKLFSEDK